MLRRTIVLAALAALLVALHAPVAGFAAAAADQPRGTRLAGIVTHVSDGDTLDLRANGRIYTVRLEGIDAPEGGQAFSQQARQLLRVLAFSQQASVVVQTTDRYGRLVARVIVGGRDLSEEMLRAGLAWHFLRYSSDKRLQALEQQARQQRVGLWSDRSAVAPWDYRSGRNRPAEPSATPPAASARPSPGSPSSVRPSPADARGTTASRTTGPFHGNVSSRVYHAPGCRDYNCKHCTQVFATRQAAEAAGYRAHAECVQRHQH